MAYGNKWTARDEVFEDYGDNPWEALAAMGTSNTAQPVPTPTPVPVSAPTPTPAPAASTTTSANDFYGSLGWGASTGTIAGGRGYKWNPASDSNWAQFRGGNNLSSSMEVGRPADEAMFRSMGYGGEFNTNYGDGESPTRTSEFLDWLDSAGIGMTEAQYGKQGFSQGSTTFRSWTDKSGNRIGQPMQIAGDSWMDNLRPFLMLAAPFAGAIGAAEAGAGAAAGSQAGSIVSSVTDAFLPELAGAAASGGAVATSTIPSVITNAVSAGAPMFTPGLVASIAGGAAAALPAFQQLEPQVINGTQAPAVDLSPAGLGAAAAVISTPAIPQLPPQVINSTPNPKLDPDPQETAQPVAPSIDSINKLDAVQVDGSSMKPVEALPEISWPSMLPGLTPLPYQPPVEAPTGSEQIAPQVINGTSSKPVDASFSPLLPLPSALPNMPPIEEAPYSNEGKNYPTPASTAASPINATPAAPDWASILKKFIGAGASGATAGSGLIGALTGAGGILDIAGKNYMYKGAADDADRAWNDYIKNSGFNKEQMDRVTSLATSIQGGVDQRMNAEDPFANVGTFNPGEYKAASTGDLTNNAYVNGAKSGVTDTLKTNYDAARTAANGAAGNVKTAQDGLAAAISGLGDRKAWGEDDVKRIGGELYGQKVGALDRALALTSSQGFSSALTKGMADSTQSADTRDSIVRSFSDKYGELQANSSTEAANRVKDYNTLQESQRNGALAELVKKFDPALQAQIMQTLTSSADNQGNTLANSAAGDSSRMLDALARADAASKSEYQAGYDTSKANFDAKLNTASQKSTSNNNQLASLLSALTGTNSQVLNSAGSMVTAASGNVGSTASAKGAALAALLGSMSSGSSRVGGVGGAIDAAGQVVNAAGQVIGKVVGDKVVDSAGKVIGAAADYVSSAASAAGDWAKDLFSGLFGGKP